MERPDTASKPVSRYEEYLPALLQGDPVVGQFLRAFEQILSGSSAHSSSESNSFKPQILRYQKNSAQPEMSPGLEEVFRNVHLYFNPDEGNAPAEFLPWLAGWVALSLRDDWPEPMKRQFIGQIVPLYQLRGTKRGLEKMLGLYLESLIGFSQDVTVYDQFKNPAYSNYFQVQLRLAYPDPERYWLQARIAKAIIDQEKPAHTYYALRILTPSMRLTGRSYPFQFDVMSELETSKTFQINFQINIVKSPNSVNLIVSLNARAYVHLQTQPRIWTVTQGDSIQCRIEAAYLPETSQWQVVLMTLRTGNDSSESSSRVPECTLRLKDLSSPLYLSVNNLNRDVMTVEIRDAQTKPLAQLELHPALRLYKQTANKKPIPDTGNTVIGTEVGRF